MTYLMKKAGRSSVMSAACCWKRSPTLIPGFMDSKSSLHWLSQLASLISSREKTLRVAINWSLSGTSPRWPEIHSSYPWLNLSRAVITVPVWFFLVDPAKGGQATWRHLQICGSVTEDLSTSYPWQNIRWVCSDWTFFRSEWSAHKLG